MPGIIIDSILGIPRSGDATFLRGNHDKGWFLDAFALRAAYPTASLGDFATVGGNTSGPSVWVWDAYILDWEDTASPGLVTSVFGRTGDILAQAGDYSAFYDTTGTATAAIVAHNLAFTHSDIALNTGARHTRSHALNSGSDHSGNLDASQLPLGGNWALTSDLVINSVAAAVSFTINRKTSGIAFKYDQANDCINCDFMRIGTTCVAVGFEAFAVTATPNYKVAVGYRAGYRCTSGGTQSVYIGYQTMEQVTDTDAQSVFIGYWAGGRRNGTGQQRNVAIGYQAMLGSTTFTDNTGVGNVCIGDGAGSSVSSGSNNVIVGATPAITTGGYNVVIGESAGAGMTGTVSRNLFLGSYAGQSETASFRFHVGAYLKSGTGYADIETHGRDLDLMYGFFSGTSPNQTLRLNANVTVKHGLEVNVAGLESSPTAPGAYNFTVNRVTSGVAFKYNGTTDAVEGDFIKVSSGVTKRVALGYQALNADTTGAGYNVGIGVGAGLLLTTGSYNTAVGYALRAATTATGNTAVGHSALVLCTGNNNTAIGLNCFSAIVGQSNCVGLGANAGYFETGSDKLMITAFQHTDEATARANAIIYGTMVTGAGSATQTLVLNADVTIKHKLIQTSAEYHYFGDPSTDGSWRIGRSGNDLVIERRESSSWVNKTTITA